VQQFGNPCAVEGARPAFEKNGVLGTISAGKPASELPSTALVSGGTPVSAERSVGSITRSAPSARLTGVV
jgi:hypothetical protein